MRPIIEVHKIGKKFKIHHNRQPYLSMRDAMVNVFKTSMRGWFNNEKDEDFWALKDVSFEVYEGESIGIIGKNGAGKSTLLKVLSRITPPSEGRITLRGRVASLLEVGTGFHPELTGRENVFFNGAILGMKRAEIKRKFDEIVDFAGIEKFIDTPLKHYSSGMQLRLAFAVAAFLEAEILVVDEVLAVGDAEFQKKCLGKMEDVTKKEGRTVLFVSHNMGYINSFCSNCIFIRDGQIVLKGETHKVIDVYNAYTNSINVVKDLGIQVSAYFEKGTVWNSQTHLIIEVRWDKYIFDNGWECDIACYTTDRIKVFAVSSSLVEGFTSANAEYNCIRFYIKNPNLSERRYLIDVGIRKDKNESYHILAENCIDIDVINMSLPRYKRNDVIVVPEVKIELKVV